MITTLTVWLRQKLTCQDLEVRFVNWACLFGVLAVIALLKQPAVALGLFAVAEILVAVSFLIWVIPAIRLRWTHWWRRPLCGALLVVSGVVQVAFAEEWIGSVTGFHPGDYTTSVASLAVLLYVPTSLALVALIVFLGSIGATLVSLPIHMVEEFASEILGTPKTAWGERIGRRAIGGLCFFGVLHFGWSGMAAGISPHLDSAVERLVLMLDYFPSQNHPWRGSFGGAVVHFHENGLVTKALERDGRIRFEVAVAPPNAP